MKVLKVCYSKKNTRLNRKDVKEVWNLYGVPQITADLFPYGRVG